MFFKPLYIYKNAFGGLPKSVWLLSAIMFVNRSGTMVLPFLTLYLTQKLHFSVADAGIVMAFYGSGALFGTFLGGKLTDKIGFYPIQFYSLLLSGIALLVLMQLTSLYSICAGVFIFTTLGDTFRPANGASIAYYSTPTNRTRSYTLNRLAINLGWSIGGGMGGILAEMDYNYLFWGDGVTCIVAAILLRILIKPPVLDTTSSKSAETHVSNLPNSAYKDKFYWVFLALVVMYAIPFFQLFSLEPLYFRTVIKLSESRIGAFMVFNGLLIATTEMIFVHTVEKRLPRPILIAIGLLLTACSFFVLNISTAIMFIWFSIAFNTIGEMFAMPFMQTLVVDRANEKNRGQYLALYSMCYSIAQISAPTIGAQIIQRWNFAELWYVMGGLCLTSMLGFLLLQKHFIKHSD
ncbi:MFS transporter [Cellulophaga sp. BC115SP]|uniref:MFS transporter n=1 Tax=Cellulophaga sp. BC115SP TaxID=2683263 RepID=UPI001413484F|nr:MFS transporter [Cellulophaga sp. BC115SP]NBB27342.1 MFS transporter [Cellulophaga sp. BC115SP]